mmetsp:Transcript_78213/g.253292  ORF Transcript_78213/g.253292 Transcript_78213/m.253292 type:complete len:268 (-) Transcript_78213:702-1505(-)
MTSQPKVSSLTGSLYPGGHIICRNSCLSMHLSWLESKVVMAWLASSFDQFHPRCSSPTSMKPVPSASRRSNSPSSSCNSDCDRVGFLLLSWKRCLQPSSFSKAMCSSSNSVYSLHQDSNMSKCLCWAHGQSSWKKSKSWMSCTESPGRRLPASCSRASRRLRFTAKLASRPFCCSSCSSSSSLRRMRPALVAWQNISRARMTVGRLRYVHILTSSSCFGQTCMTCGMTTGSECERRKPPGWPAQNSSAMALVGICICVRQKRSIASL